MQAAGAQVIRVLTQGGRDKEEQEKGIHRHLDGQSVAIGRGHSSSTSVYKSTDPEKNVSGMRLWCLKPEAIRLEMISTLKKRHIEDLKVNPVLYEVWPSREEFNRFLRRHLSDEGLWPQ